jgi:hypothetical protein
MGWRSDVENPTGERLITIPVWDASGVASVHFILFGISGESSRLNQSECGMGSIHQQLKSKVFPSFIPTPSLTGLAIFLSRSLSKDEYINKFCYYPSQVQGHAVIRE